MLMAFQSLFCNSSFYIPYSCSSIPRPTYYFLRNTLAQTIDGSFVSLKDLHRISSEIHFEDFCIFASSEEAITTYRRSCRIYESRVVGDFLLKVIFSSRVSEWEQFGGTIYRSTKHKPWIKCWYGAYCTLMYCKGLLKHEIIAKNRLWIRCMWFLHWCIFSIFKLRIFLFSYE